LELSRKPLQHRGTGATEDFFGCEAGEAAPCTLEIAAGENKGITRSKIFGVLTQRQNEENTAVSCRSAFLFIPRHGGLVFLGGLVLLGGLVFLVLPLPFDQGKVEIASHVDFPGHDLQGSRYGFSCLTTQKTLCVLCSSVFQRFS
jgi:hypothetical protein